MASRKVTFTLDAVTIAKLNESAARLAASKSEIVREAIREFHGRLSELERLRMLHAFDELVPKIPLRGAAEVDLELGRTAKITKPWRP